MSHRKLPVGEIVIELYKSGLSGEEIAERYGAHPVTVIQALKKLGVERRTMKEATKLSEAKGRMGGGSKRPRFKSGRANPNWNGGRSVDRCYVRILAKGHPRATPSTSQVYEHILIAEKALGKPLPQKAVVHHHTPEQIVICQDAAYHSLLHARERALKACGRADWRKCKFCHQYGDPHNMVLRPRSGVGREGQLTSHHKVCENENQLKRHKKKRLAEKKGL